MIFIESFPPKGAMPLGANAHGTSPCFRIRIFAGISSMAVVSCDSAAPRVSHIQENARDEACPKHHATQRVDRARTDVQTEQATEQQLYVAGFRVVNAHRSTHCSASRCRCNSRPRTTGPSRTN